MSESSVKVTVLPDKVLSRVSRHLTGACLEDVNHEIYGGIYSQMIFGESFEEDPMEIHPELNPQFAGLSGTISCVAEREHLSAASEVRTWQPFRTGTAEGVLKATQLRARRGVRSQRIEFNGGSGAVGIENRGLNRWGLHFAEGKRYEGVVVAAAAHPAGASSALPIYVTLESGDGSRVYAEQRLEIPADGGWHVVPFSVGASAEDRAGRLALGVRERGSVWIDYVRLTPGEWGRFGGTAARRDIAEALVRQGLTVLRCGGYMTNTDWQNEIECPGSGYRWKKMIGPREDRPPYRGTFYRFESNGFGVVDFMNLCEAAGFLCVPTLNPSETPEDLGDFVEYANGGPGTVWGARRLADGHPKPYGLKYVEIGNEEFGHTSDWGIDPGYANRIRPILAALKERDPSVIPIFGAPLHPGTGATAGAHERIREIVEASRSYHVLWDMHVGGDGLQDAHEAERGLRWMRDFIDSVDPGNHVGLCVLEENGSRHDVQRALGHAHMIQTFERLGLVEMDTPANCLQPYHENDNAWDQGQVFFTPGQAWGMPPFYAQQMLAGAYLPLCVHADADGGGEAIDVTATVSEDRSVRCVKLLNLGEEKKAVSIAFADSWSGKETRAELLTGALNDENTPEEPGQISPKAIDVRSEGGAHRLELPPRSFVVVRFSA